MTEESTIREDVPANDLPEDGYSLEEAAAALLKRRKDAHQPSEPATKDAPSETPDPEPETAETEEEDSETPEADESPEDPEKTPAAEASDDHVVKVKVDGEEHQVSVKDLKRLWGQEAALTRKSQEIATLRKQIEDEAAKYNTGLEKLVEKAKARFEPFENQDWIELRHRVDAETYQALRKEAQEAYQDYAFLTQELDGVRQQSQQKAQAQLLEQAKDCLKAIQNPESPHHIADWSPDVYRDLRGFAVQQGIPGEAMDTETSPAVLKILHMAMQYSKAQQVATKKLTKASPKKTMASKEAPGRDDGERSVKTRFAKSGSLEDAAALLLQRSRNRKS